MQLHERSIGGFRLSPKPPTRLDEGSSSRCSRRKRDAQSCQPISTAVQQYSVTPTASRKSTKTIKPTRLTIRRRTRRIQPKKSPVERAVFDWRNPTVKEMAQLRVSHRFMACETTTGTPINVNPVNVGTKQDNNKRLTEKQHTQPTKQCQGSEHTPYWLGHLQDPCFSVTAVLRPTYEHVHERHGTASSPN